MHRLLVGTELLDDGSPSLPKEALNHLKVLRPKVGERIELFDGRGRWRIYSFSGGGRSNTPLRAETAVFSASASDVGLTLFACVTKGSRWDWTIEKATELGVTRIVPVISDRTIVRIPQGERPAKRERWQRIAEDAARQSDAKWLPEIHEAVDFGEALVLVKETTCFIGALTNPPSPHLLQAASRLRSGSCERPPAVFIGPEGDFTPEELSSLMEVAMPTSFGPTILRAETAAIFAVSVLSSVGSLEICYNSLKTKEED